MDKQSCYRRLTPYKYQLLEDFRLELSISASPSFDNAFIVLSPEGRMIIRKGYAWDGPSGPAFDTSTFMRGSLVHDALYQLMRLGVLQEEQHRKGADQLLRNMCLEDGMWPVRAWYVYAVLRLFGANHARHRNDSVIRKMCAP